MNGTDLLALARRHLWWRAPAAALADRPRLIAQVMESGTWEEAEALLAAWGSESFRAVLAAPPPGVLSAKSWHFWHLRLHGAPPSTPLPPGRRLPAAAPSP